MVDEVIDFDDMLDGCGGACDKFRGNDESVEEVALAIERVIKDSDGEVFGLM